MHTDKNLRTVEAELNFISRHLQTVEGNGGSDFEAIDEIYMAINSAKRALAEYGRGLQVEAPTDAVLVTTYELFSAS